MSVILRELFRLAVPSTILAAGVFGYMSLSRFQTDAESPEPVDPRPLVETAQVEEHDGGVPLYADGVVVPFREVQLATQVAGRISSRPELCRAGRFVKQGDVLFEIDDTDYQLEVRRLERELKQSEDSLAELDVEIQNSLDLLKLADEDVELRQRELKRLLSLKERSALSDTDLDAGRSAELNSRNARAGVQNQLRLQQRRRSRLEATRDVVNTQLEKSQLDLSRCRIAAPMDGVIVEEHVEVDSYVQTGATLLTIEDTSAVEVKCNLRAEQLFRILNQPSVAAEQERQPSDSYLLPPLPVEVHYDLAGRTFAWSGVLSRYDGIGIEEQTRTIPCRVRVDNPRDVRFAGSAGTLTSGAPRALVRGMYVALQMETESPSPLLRVPEQAVLPGNRVWTVHDGKLRESKVRVVQTLPDSVVVEGATSGLSVGDRAVVSPLSSASGGLEVREADKP